MDQRLCKIQNSETDEEVGYKQLHTGRDRVLRGTWATQKTWLGNDKQILMKLKKLLYPRETQSVKRQPTEWEKIVASYISD